MSTFKNNISNLEEEYVSRVQLMNKIAEQLKDTDNVTKAKIRILDVIKIIYNLEAISVTSNCEPSIIECPKCKTMLSSFEYNNFDYCPFCGNKLH